ncbi:MAG: tetratricopeptide repeat protein, partial [Candidatus Eisenbacteria bacterium]|nr:tetratricopeptide repeat protein [Candidatus Eisenbacteria bacterium]
AELRLAGARYLQDKDLSIDPLIPRLEPEYGPPAETPSAFWFLVGNTYLARGDYAAALAPLARCLEIDPDAAVCYRALGDALHFLGWYEKALYHYSRYLRYEPKDKEIEKTVEKLRRIIEDG